MLRATLNESVPLQVLVPDGRSDLFARVHLYTASGSLLTTLYPLHVAEGLYSVNWSPSVEGYFSVVYELFLDAGFTITADYDKDGEVIEVSSEKINLARLLGLNHENGVLDQQVYNSSNRLIQARLRAYDSKVNAQAAGSTGLLFTWTVLATYDSQNRADTFRILKEP